MTPDLQAPYRAVVDFMIASGDRIRSRSGDIEDLGVVKRYLTEEDLRIENELADLIAGFGPDHALFAEEAHDELPDAPDVWVCDPISGTRTFLLGLAHYGIVVSHLHEGSIRFAAVHDPTTGELFHAVRGQGAFRNGRPIAVSDHVGPDGPRIVFNLTYDYRSPAIVPEMFRALTEFDLYRNTNSFAVSYCHVACGRYDGFVTFSKDAFPEFAGSLILREAGGRFETFAGSVDIHPEDHQFLGGAPVVFDAVRAIADRF
jgi:myo-inositol-1(or 4)-monophosphatase